MHAGEAIIADCRRRYPVRKFSHALEVRDCVTLCVSVCESLVYEYV